MRQTASSMIRFLLAVCCLGFASCGPGVAGLDGGDADDASVGDGGGRADAGPTPDAGPDAGALTDAGSLDAGPAFDAGVFDAGTPDAGAPDAGLDAGLPDAGAGRDAGALDGGLSDAGTRDAGPIVPFDAGVVTPPAWLAALPANTWHELPNSKPNAAQTSYPDPLGGALSPVKQGLFAYSGAAVAGTRLVVAGGGHTDYAGNEVIAIDFAADAPRWQLLRAPTPNSQITQGVRYYADGAPISRHTYWELWHNPYTNRLMFIGAGSIFNAAGGATPWTDGFDLTTNTYDHVTGAMTHLDNPGGPYSNLPETPHAQDSSFNVWVQSDSGEVRRWNALDGSWTSKGAGIARSGPSPLVHDPLRARLVRLGTQYAVVQTGLAGSGSVTETPIVFTGLASKAANQASAFFVPQLDRIFVKPFNETTVYQIDATFQVSTYPLAGTPPPLPGPGYLQMYGRFNVIPSLRLVVHAGSTESNVFVFKY